MISFSGCGVLGILRKSNAPKIKGDLVIRAIERVRYRGSDRGAGFAIFNKNFFNSNKYIVKAFYHGDPEELKEILSIYGLSIEDWDVESMKDSICSCIFYITANNLLKTKRIFRNINEMLWKFKKGRLYSFGNSLNIFKGTGYPKDIAEIYNIKEIEGDLWLAHTRQPTNSPGHYPYWSHPFSSFNIAVVHNGDISSFGANVEFLMGKGWKGFVGTDSEVIAFLFEELMEEGLNIEDAVKILINPSRRRSILSREIEYLYRNARLDGPFAAIIGYDSGDDIYLIGIIDRSKFRPIIISEDEHYYYIASEENEIREINPKTKTWTLKPGSYFIASLNKGIINYGRDEEELKSFSSYQPIFLPEKYDIDAKNLGYKELNYMIAKIAKTKKEISVANVMGHRYIGINFKRLGIENIKINLYGVVGNCMANLNENNEFHVYGNVADDCCDTMHGGKVVIYGNAGDVLAQAFQGGKIFIKGNAGNRVGIQMREYKNRKPYLIIGGMVDDYLGEYMAGGVIVILGLNIKNEPVGNFIGSGMIGGKIYIRGKISMSKLGLQPNKFETLRFLKALLLENIINNNEYEILKEKESIELINILTEKAKHYAKKLFFEEKIGIPNFEYRELSEEEHKELYPIMKEYGQDIKYEVTELLKEKFTIIKPNTHYVTLNR